MDKAMDIDKEALMNSLFLGQGLPPQKMITTHQGMLLCGCHPI